ALPISAGHGRGELGGLLRGGHPGHVHPGPRRRHPRRPGTDRCLGDARLACDDVIHRDLTEASSTGFVRDDTRSQRVSYGSRGRRTLPAAGTSTVPSTSRSVSRQPARSSRASSAWAAWSHRLWTATTVAPPASARWAWTDGCPASRTAWSPQA